MYTYIIYIYIHTCINIVHLKDLNSRTNARVQQLLNQRYHLTHTPVSNVCHMSHSYVP